MNATEKALARILFQSRVFKLSGMAYQNFFSSIMSYAKPDFVSIKPQGPEGDWKNDGHEPNRGCYYQVYSPERFDESASIKKLEEDFMGLVEKWGDNKVYPIGIKEFYFVINDAYRVVPGGYPTTVAKLEHLKRKHGLNECKLFLVKDLEDFFMNLKDDQIQALVGFLPNPADIGTLSFSCVDEVIKHILENPITRSLDQTLISPDYDQKIAFNGLKLTGIWLKDAVLRCGSLEDYFNANSQFLRQEIRDKLKNIYESSKATNTSDRFASADHQLIHILNQISPILPNENQRLSKELQDAALVVLAYFFESCDIFEEPV